MSTPAAGVRVEGVRELTRALNSAGRQDLTKAMGAANKQLGVEIIARLQPLPASVGLGAGAKVRPSASARLVQLKAGGAHRDGPSDRAVAVRSWGRRPVNRGGPRPNIAETALRALPRIERRYLEAIDDAVRSAKLPGLR